MVVKGFQQRECIDFTEILSCCEANYLRSILSIVAANDLHLEQLGVKIVFLHGGLEDIYMMQPHGLQAQEESLWLETCSEAVVSEVQQIHD